MYKFTCSLQIQCTGLHNVCNVLKKNSNKFANSSLCAKQVNSLQIFQVGVPVHNVFSRLVPVWPQHIANPRSKCPSHHPESKCPSHHPEKAASKMSKKCVIKACKPFESRQQALCQVCGNPW